MKWERETDYSLISECRRYRICKFWIGGELFYETWRGRTMLETRLPSKEAAEAVVTDEQLEAIGEMDHEREVSTD